MSMKVGQIVREGLANAALGAVWGLRNVHWPVLPPLEPAYDVLRECLNASVARA